MTKRRASSPIPDLRSREIASRETLAGVAFDLRRLHPRQNREDAEPVGGTDCAADPAAGRSDAQRQIVPLSCYTIPECTPTKALSDLAIAALAVSFTVQADVTLPHILAEHMVLQRDLPVHVWGKATPDEAVAVTFRGATQATQRRYARPLVRSSSAGQRGRSRSTSPSKPTTQSPSKDILVGADVWSPYPAQSNDGIRRCQADERAGRNRHAAEISEKIRRTLLDRQGRRLSARKTHLPSRGPTARIPTTPEVPLVAYFFVRHLQEKLERRPDGHYRNLLGRHPGRSLDEPARHWLRSRADADLQRMGARPKKNWPTAQANYEKQLATWTAASKLRKPA